MASQMHGFNVGTRESLMARKARSFRPDFQNSSAVLETRELLATLPQGLVIKNLSENLGGPTTFVSDHESKMFVGDLDGSIRSISLVDGKASIIGKLNAENVDARGLYGLAMDPGFATNQTLYAFYYALDGVGGREVRVSKLMVHEATDPSITPELMETVLMRIKISNSPQMHHGGALEVDKNGYLYFAIGDIEEPKKISKIDMPNGKVFRIRTDGTIPKDNPFYRRSKGLGRAVWATGLREPMKSSYDTATDTYMIHDVGWFQTEELNVIKKGANYGWPYFEGKNQSSLKGGNASKVTFPFYSYQNMTSLTQKTFPLNSNKKVKSMIALNSDVGCASMGGVYYRPDKLQDTALSEYVGNYLFVDLCSGWVNALDYNTKQVKRLADQVDGQLMDVEYTNDGRIFLLCRGDASVDNQIKVIEAQQNDPPGFSNDGGSIIASAGESLDLNATLSGPGPFTYQWYHNGQPIPDSVDSSLKFTSLNQQADSGQYYVTAKNAFGESVSMPWDIQVSDRARPTINLTVSKDGQTIKKGDRIAFSATGTDQVDGDLGASQYSWNLELRHNTHGHPVFALANTKASEFTVGDYSYETGTLSLKLSLTVTNSIGLTKTVTKQWPVVI
jgi:glucose/arabinose dehydrogenase